MIGVGFSPPDVRLSFFVPPATTTPDDVVDEDDDVCVLMRMIRQM